MMARYAVGPDGVRCEMGEGVTLEDVQEFWLERDPVAARKCWPLLGVERKTMELKTYGGTDRRDALSVLEAPSRRSVATLDLPTPPPLPSLSAATYAAEEANREAKAAEQRAAEARAVAARARLDDMVRRAENLRIEQGLAELRAVREQRARWIAQLDELDETISWAKAHVVIVEQPKRMAKMEMEIADREKKWRELGYDPELLATGEQRLRYRFGLLTYGPGCGKRP